MRCENALTMTTDEPNDALGALLRLALREFAATPAVPLVADRAGRPGIVRVAAPATDEFTHLLVTVFTESRASLVSQARRKVSSVQDAEDVVQSAFMRVFAGRPEVDSPERLGAYLRRTVDNVANDALRRIIADREHQDADHELDELCRQADLRFDDRIAVRDSLLSALVVLAPREHEAIVLRWYGDHTLAQVGRIMGIAENSVKAYVHYGLRKIREHLQS